MIGAIVFFAALTSTVPSDVQEPAGQNNTEIAQIFADDQAARQTGDIDWEKVGREDELRRQRVRKLLDTGALATGEDFYAAAFIFQHGADPDDYLLAHALAVRSLGLGYPAEWIAAATLDRYLQSTGRGQVYGTQYWNRPGEPYGQGAYDRNLLTEQLRLGAHVETLVEQEAKVAQRNVQAKQSPLAKPTAQR